MGAIEDTYEDLDTEVSLEEFREAVEQKVEQMGGLADEETAAMLIAHDLTEGEVETIADVEPGMEDVKFVGKVVSVGEVRTFEREGEDEPGRVLNVEVADETGRVRVALWDEQAAGASEQLETGDVLRVAGRPKDGYSGLEVSANRVEPAEDVEIDVSLTDTVTADSLSMGQSDVNLRGVVLDTESVRTFSRDDGSEGRVANLTLGDETGRVRVTLWDERAGRAEALDPGTTVEVVDGYVRERDGGLELHVGSRGAIEETETGVTFTPQATDIGALELGETADIAGVVRSAEPKNTFDRDDGGQGQVRNVRVQDQTGDIRVALWGEKADRDVGPGDEVFLADVEIQDGYQEAMEASAGWRSTVVELGGALSRPDGDGDTDTAVAAGTEPGTGTGTDSTTARDGDGDATLGAYTGDGATAGEASGTDEATETAATDTTDGTTGVEEFTGVVVQTGDPVMLDDGERTCIVETSTTVTLGQEVTVRGRRDGERLVAEELR
jgi:replication factor A1